MSQPCDRRRLITAFILMASVVMTMSWLLTNRGRYLYDSSADFLSPLSLSRGERPTRNLDTVDDLTVSLS